MPLPYMPYHVFSRTMRPYASGIDFFLDFAGMADLPVKAQRHPWLRYKVLDFEGMNKEMGMDIDARLSIRHKNAKRLVVFTIHAWRRLFDNRGPLVRELMLEFFSTCRFDDLVLDLDAEGVLSFQLGGARHTMSWRQFILAIVGRGQAPKKVTRTGLYFIRSMDQEAVNLPYLFAHYLFRRTEGRKRGAQMSGGHFISRLANHFGLLTEESVRGMTMVVRKLGEIELDELARLHNCESLGDTWAWVAPGLERQAIVAAGALEVAEVAPDVKEGA
ncbi:hypothetical protein Tco_0265454 [Tanacetum coccineum]